MSLFRLFLISGAGLAFLLSPVGPKAMAEPVDPTEVVQQQRSFPLRPADVSSPRDSLRNFLDNFSDGLTVWRSDGSAIIYKGEIHLASRTFDFTALSSRTGRINAFEKMIFFQEILDRIGLPPWEQIPGDAELERNDLQRWVIPNTEIELVKVTEGHRIGDFLISKASVERLRRYYLRVKHLPYLPDAQKNLHTEFLVSPGPLIPRHWIAALPSGAKQIPFLDTAVWQWVALILTLLLGSGLAIASFRLGQRWDIKMQEHSAWMRFGSPTALTLIILLAFGARKWVVEGIWLFGIVYEAFSIVIWTVIFVCIAWLIILSIGRIGVAIAHARHDEEEESQEGKVDYSMVRILFRILGGILVALLAIYAADFLGIAISPLVAGLSISGLAVALAIRPLLENVISGLTLYADGGIKVGDFCRYGNEVGQVEHIGLRSTRIRTLERSLVTVPNAEFEKLQLDNLAQRDKRRLNTVLKLRYETSTDQLRYLLANLRKLLYAHPMVDSELVRVRFVGFGDFSMDVVVQAYLRCKDQDSYLAIQEDILLRINESVEKAGCGFAFSSQRAFLGRAEALDEQRQQQAEDKVKQWRDEQRLPFPDFASDVQHDLKDTLTYPPKGSATASPNTGQESENKENK